MNVMTVVAVLQKGIKFLPQFIFMIKLILFDFGGVLGSDADDWDKTFSKILFRTGLAAEDLSKIWNLHWDQMKIGKYDLGVFLGDVSAAGKNHVSVQELLSIYKDGIWLNESTIALAKDLWPRGCALAILSNETKSGMRFKIEKFGLYSIFSKIYCSSDVGFAKPDEKVFLYVLENNKVDSQTTLLIDDREKNISAARKLGMATIFYENSEHLRIELASIGLL